MTDYLEGELEFEISTLTSKLALANRALEEANQSITEYEHANAFMKERIAELEAIIAPGWQSNYAHYYRKATKAEERIAQLEARLERAGK